MSKKILLKPDEFQSQIDEFKAKNDVIKSLKFKTGREGLKLNSVDKYKDCIVEFNHTMQLLNELLDMDAKSMQLIKAKWMNTDGEIATKTLGEILTDK